MYVAIYISGTQRMGSHAIFICNRGIVCEHDDSQIQLRILNPRFLAFTYSISVSMMSLHIAYPWICSSHVQVGGWSLDVAKRGFGGGSLGVGMRISRGSRATRWPAQGR
jgi:hypothetical protein